MTCRVVVLFLHEVPPAGLPRKQSFTVHHAIPSWKSDVVERRLREYVVKVGVKDAFDLRAYNSLPKAYAVRGADLLYLEPFLRAILDGAPCGEVCVDCLHSAILTNFQIIHFVTFHVAFCAFLCQSCTIKVDFQTMKRIYVDILAAYPALLKGQELQYLGGKLSDRTLVILSHVRRCCCSDLRVHQASRSLSEEDYLVSCRCVCVCGS
jgi:hypothetical protein